VMEANDTQLSTMPVLPCKASVSDTSLNSRHFD
jgi:hypothetical protein